MINYLVYIFHHTWYYHGVEFSYDMNSSGSGLYYDTGLWHTSSWCFVPWKFVGMIYPSCSSHSFSMVDSWLYMIFMINVFMIPLISNLFLDLLTLDIILDLFLLPNPHLIPDLCLLLVQIHIAHRQNPIFVYRLHCFNSFPLSCGCIIVWIGFRFYQCVL